MEKVYEDLLGGCYTMINDELETEDGDEKHDSIEVILRAAVQEYDERSETSCGFRLTEQTKGSK